MKTRWVNANCVEKKGVEWKQTTKSLDALWFARSAGQSYTGRTVWQRISAVPAVVVPFANRIGETERVNPLFLSLFYFLERYATIIGINMEGIC